MRLSVALLLLTPLFATGPSQAARSYDNCTAYVNSVPAVISTQGTWCMNKDLSTGIQTGAAITIAANNVTLDCNDFKLGGLAAGVGTATIGVRADGRVNATLRNCNIRGFLQGVALLSAEGIGGGHLVEDNRLEGNTAVGVNINGDNSTIRDNLILDTGGSTGGGGEAIGALAVGDGIDVMDNTISGLDAGTIYGIFLASPPGGNGTIGRNRVRGASVVEFGSVTGIVAISGRTFVHDNLLHGPPGTNTAVGINCTAPDISARGNQLVSFNTPVTGCTVEANFVNPN